MPSAIDRLIGISDAQDVVQTDAADQEKRKEKWLPERVKARRAGTAAQAAGEPPEVTDYYRKMASPIMAHLTPELKKKRQERLTNEFFSANPRYNETLTPETAKTATEKAEVQRRAKGSATDELLQNIIKTVTLTDIDLKTMMAKKQAIKQYDKVKKDLSPEVRAKYNLDAFEQAGLLTKEDSGTLGWKNAVGSLVETPGIKQGLGGLARTAAVGGALVNDVGVGVGKAIDAIPGSPVHSTRDFGGWSGIKQAADEHRGFGQQLYENLQKQAEDNPQGRAQVFGIDTGALDEKGKFQYNATGGGLLDRNVGKAITQLGGLTGDVVTDPTSYTGLGAGAKATAGFKALENAGLEDVARLIKREGWKALDETQTAAARAAIEESVSKGIEAGAKGSAEDLAGGVQTALERRGQSGLKVGGRTVLPTKNLPGAGRVSTAKSAIDEVTSKIAPADIRPGDVLNIGGERAPITHFDGGKTITIEPTGSIPVLRGREKLLIPRTDIRVGDKLMDGEAKVLSNVPDGGMEVEMSRKLINAERSLDIFPRHENGTQGTLVEQGTAEAEPRVREADRTLIPEAGTTMRQSDIENPLFPRPADPNAGQQGKLFTGSGTVRDAVEAVDNAPTATAAGGYADVVKRALDGASSKPISGAENIFVRTADDGAGGKILGLYDHQDNLLGYLMSTDDAINTFESLSKVPGMGQKLLKAAEDSGLDVPKLLSNSDFTDAGRASAKKYLNWLEVDVRPGDMPAQEARTISVPVRTEGGAIIDRRPWRVRGDRRMVKEDWEILGRDRQTTLGNIKGYTPEGVMRYLPANAETRALEIGDIVPEVYGRVVGKQGDILEILPEEEAVQKLAPRGEQAYLTGGVEGQQAVSSPVSPGELPAEPTSTTPSVEPSQAQGGASGDELKPLSERGAYGPKPTDQIEKARVTPGEVSGGLDPDAQARLFDKGYVSVDDLSAGDRLPTLKGEIISKSGKSLVVDLDEGMHTVIRDHVTERMTSSEIRKGDILPDVGAEVSAANDGVIKIRGLIGAERTEFRTTLGGATQETPSVGARVKASAPGAKTGDFFSPRAGVKREERAGIQAEGTAGKLYERQTEAAAKVSNQVTEAGRLVKGAWDQVKKDFKDPLEAFRAVDVADLSKANDYIAGLRKAGKNSAADGLEQFITARQLVLKAESKFDVSAGLFEVKAQRPLILTEEGEQLMKHDALIRQAFLGEKRIDNLTQGFDFAQTDHGLSLRIEPEHGMRERPIDIDMQGSAADINEQLSKAINGQVKRTLGIDPNETVRIFDDNPLTVFAMRSRTAFPRAVEGEMLQGLSDDGILSIIKSSGFDDPLLSIERSQAEAARKGLVKVDGFDSPLGEVWTTPEVAKELSNIRSVYTNDENLREFGKAAKSVSDAWARLVTSPVTKGFSFQARNFTTNTVQTAVGGVIDGFASKIPAASREAVRVHGAVDKAWKLVETKGMLFDDALAEVADGRTLALVKSAREKGILNEGFFRNLNYEDTTRDIKLLTSRKAKLKAAINPLDPDFIISKPGRHINERIEDFSRLTHYIAVLDATGSVDEAARSVRKYLFDYGDLTPFEKKTMRNVNRFYTFMRKNTALQFSMMAQNPGRYANAYRMIGHAFGGDQSLLYPEESKQGVRPAAPVFNTLLNGGKPGALSIDTPLDAAIQSIDPLFQGAVLAIDGALPGKAGISQYLPMDEQPTLKSFSQSLFESQVAGAPAAFVDTLYAWRTGVDPRSGRPLTDSDAKARFITTIAPVWGQGKKSIDAATHGDRKDLVRLVTGINYYDRSTDKARTSLLYAYSRELDDTLKALKDQGVDVPTLDELRAAGIVPSVSESQGPVRKVEKTAEQKKQEARDKLLGK